MDDLHRGRRDHLRIADRTLIGCCSNGWSPAPRRLVTGIAGGSVILLGMGAGAIALPTIVIGGLAIGRTTISLTVRLLIVGFIALLVVAVGGSGSSTMLFGLVAVGVMAGILIVGYRTRFVIAGLALLPVGFVIVTILIEDGGLPMWQRVAGAALYAPLLLPLTIWFARTVAPLQARDSV